jgi:DNA-binding XRE family transcriptional regulator
MQVENTKPPLAAAVRLLKRVRERGFPQFSTPLRLPNLILDRVYLVRAVGQRVAEVRSARDISQDTLAKAIGVTGKTVSNWERGRGKGGIKESKLIQIAAVLKCDLADLLAAPGSPVPLSKP